MSRFSPVMPMFRFENGHTYLKMDRWEYEDLFALVWEDISMLGLENISPADAFEATIRFLTKGIKLKAIGRDYGLDEDKTEEVVMEVVRVLSLLGIQDFVIRNNFWRAVEQEFILEYGFPNCVGALGAIRMKATTGRKILWMPVKKTITVFAIADCRQRIILAEALMGPQKTFADTVLYRKMCDNELNIPSSSRLNFTDALAPKVFVAGENFEQLSSVCVPYPRPRADVDYEMSLYNSQVDGVRSNIDMALYNLHKTFRILKNFDIVNCGYATDVIHSCINLYNYKINYNGPVREGYFRDLSYIQVSKRREDVLKGERVRRLFVDYFTTRMAVMDI